MEMIRIKTINRLGSMVPTCEKWINHYIPSCNEMFWYYQTLAVGLTVLFNGDIGYEISEGEDNHIVCLNANSCTCRGWDLSGIPYEHAISLQEKSELETDNSVSNPSGNGIPEGLETEFLVFKTLVSNCVRLNSVSN